MSTPSMPTCALCGRSAPEMIALMNVRYGELVGLPPEPGYFYLCPPCHEEKIEPFRKGPAPQPAPSPAA